MELIGTPMDSIFNSKETDKGGKFFYDQSSWFTFTFFRELLELRQKYWNILRNLENHFTSSVDRIYLEFD